MIPWIRRSRSRRRESPSYAAEHSTTASERATVALDAADVATTNAMLPACLYAAVSSAAVALQSLLWLAIILLHPPWWLHMLSKKRGDVPNGVLPRQQFVQLLYHSC